MGVYDGRVRVMDILFQVLILTAINYLLFALGWCLGIAFWSRWVIITASLAAGVIYMGTK